jgi:hypothetical protein
MELPYRILVFGSYSVGKTSLINLLTGANLKTGNSANGNTFEFEEAGSTFDNRKFLFVDTMGLSECLLSNEVNSYNKLKQFLKDTKDEGFNLIIHVKKMGSIDEVDKTNYDFVTNKLFPNEIKPVCVISFAESNMRDPKKWWNENKSSFENNQMLYNDGICVCLGHPDDPEMEEYFKKLREKSRQLLWDLIVRNIHREPIKLKLNIFDSLMQNLSKLFGSLNNKLKNYVDVPVTNRAIEQHNQRNASNGLNILVVLDQKESSILQFYRGFIENQMNPSNFELKERDNLIKIKKGQITLNFYFLNANEALPNRQNQVATTKFLYKRFFNYMKSVNQNVKFNYFVNHSKECDLLFDFIKDCFLNHIDNNKLSSILNIYDGEFKINFKALVKVNPKELYNFDFSDEYWEEICQRYNFRNDLDIGQKIDCELYECALMCYSLNNSLDDNQKSFIRDKKKWYELFKSSEFNIPLDNYKGITYYKKSIFCLENSHKFHF